jgi:hypothetical protein
VEFVNAKILIF